MFNAKTDKKTAIFFADGCEEVEALTTYDILYRAGIPCTKVSINADEYVKSSHDVIIKCDTTIDKFNFDECDMIILPGGMPGTPNLRACDALCKEIITFAGFGKPIAAICAAPSILAELGILRGVKACCNPSKEAEVESEGALLSREQVVVSDNIITSRAMGTAIPFGLAIVKFFLGDGAASYIKSNILYSG